MLKTTFLVTHLLLNRDLSRALRLITLIIGLLNLSNPARAGVFNIPHFVAPGSFAVGLEPDFTFNDSVTSGLNARYSQGINELNNFHLIAGLGGPQRGFRLGAAYSFDYFPDLEKQPGIGFAFQSLYINRSNVGSMDITIIPYIHKSFYSNDQYFEPFLSYPLGITLSAGQYRYIGTLVLGSLFKHTDHFNSIIEVGFKMNNSDTYISGGIVYYN